MPFYGDILTLLTSFYPISLTSLSQSETEIFMEFIPERTLGEIRVNGDLIVSKKVENLLIFKYIKLIRL